MVTWRSDQFDKVKGMCSRLDSWQSIRTIKFILAGPDDQYITFRIGDWQNTFKTKNRSSVSILLAMNFVERSMCSIISGIQNRFSIFLTKTFLVSTLAKENVHRQIKRICVVWSTIN